MLRGGKIGMGIKGVGGGVVASLVASRVSPDPTVNTVAGLAGGYAFGGAWGALGYAALRFFTGGLQLGPVSLSAGSVGAGLQSAQGSVPGLQVLR